MMKRQILSISLVLTLALGLSGCSCKHQWKDATCTTPATCAKCGETAGSPLGHNWKDATCTQLETCSVCGATNGQPLDHQWQEATCTQPKTCSVCGATNGQPIDHQWLPATCTEPETCSVCGETQGEAPAGHVLDRNGVCTVCGEAVGTPLNMGNYTQYLNFFADYGTPKSEFYKESTYHKTSTTYYTYYYYYIPVDISVTSSALYTYHDVEVTYKLTSNFSEWTQPNQTFQLDELGGVVGGPTQKAYWRNNDGTRKYDWGVSFKKIDLDFNIVNVTGYVLPATAGEQGPLDGEEG